MYPFLLQRLFNFYNLLNGFGMIEIKSGLFSQLMLTLGYKHEYLFYFQAIYATFIFLKQKRIFIDCSL